MKQSCGEYRRRKSSSVHRANYPAKTQKAIQKMIRKPKIAQLQEISQHQIKNAWYKCRFNLANNWGIHGA
jgi:hypothetical protein